MKYFSVILFFILSKNVLYATPKMKIGVIGSFSGGSINDNLPDQSMLKSVDLFFANHPEIKNYFSYEVIDYGINPQNIPDLLKQNIEKGMKVFIGFTKSKHARIALESIKNSDALIVS